MKNFGKALMLLLAFLPLFAGAQNHDISKLLTAKFAGLYAFGNSPENEAGSIIIYPETDSTVVFYIELNRGAPSYSSGSAYGRIKLKNGKGLFYAKPEDAENGCKWLLVFSGNRLKIETRENEFDCGFGHGVYADGEYVRKSKAIIPYFETMEGEKMFFNKITPEEYNK
jgi:hypothetical protein